MLQQKNNIYSVLLAGGTGTRLWPVSRELYPKQLVTFIGRDSLIQNTIKRLPAILPPEKIRIVCGKEHLHEIQRHINEIGIPAEGKIICEPCGRNTGPAILLAVLSILKTENDAVICVFPADHIIRQVNKFHEKIRSAIKSAEEGYIVTFGIKPVYPETGYGYIQAEKSAPLNESFKGVLAAKRFVEKPDIQKAKEYYEAGNFFWNSGMFAFKASVILDEFKSLQPELVQQMEKLFLTNAPIAQKDYKLLDNISIDYAIMEKSDKVVILPSDFGWSDIGSWKSLYDFLPKDENNNIIEGDVIVKDTNNCLILGRKRLIATNRIDNLVIIDTPDSVFVSEIDTSREVKAIVESLKKKGRKEYRKHLKVNYSWGSATVLEKKAEYQVDKLIIRPESTLRVKMETDFVCHLTVVKGEAEIAYNGLSRILPQGESESRLLSAGDTVYLKNRLNKALHIIQVKTPKFA